MGLAVPNPRAALRSRDAGVTVGARSASGPASPAPVPPDGCWLGVHGRAGARVGAGAAIVAAGAGARERVIAALFVIAALVLAVPAVLRAARRRRAEFE